MKPRTIVLTLALVTALAIPAGVAAADAGDATSIEYAQTDDATNETTNESTNESATGENPDFDDGDDPELADDGAPGDAQSLRVTPVQFDEPWLNTETTSSDEAYETSGPFAVFAISAPAENARIAQSSADAQLLDGEQTVKVEYDDDAAAENGTLFQLELFFADGSQTTLELTAHQTAVSVDGAEYAAYATLIERMEDGATDRGFEATPEGTLAFQEWQEERVEIIESFLVERAEQLFALGVMFVQNPLAWVLALLVLAGASYRREQVHGFILDRMENDAGETARKHAQLKQAHREHVEAANEEYIGDMKEVTDQQAQYLRDAFDTYSVRQLAELAKRGPHDLDRNDDLAADGGDPEPAIARIDTEEVHESWLEPGFSTNRLSDPQEVLTCIRAALVRMDSKYGLGYQYAETREDLETLLEEISDSEARY